MIRHATEEQAGRLTSEVDVATIVEAPLPGGDGVDGAAVDGGPVRTSAVVVPSKSEGAGDDVEVPVVSASSDSSSDDTDSESAVKPRSMLTRLLGRVGG